MGHVRRLVVHSVGLLGLRLVAEKFLVGVLVTVALVLRQIVGSLRLDIHWLGATVNSSVLRTVVPVHSCWRHISIVVLMAIHTYWPFTSS